MKKLFDLRFVIGLFFTVIGSFLVIYYQLAEATNVINLWCGLIFSVFGLLMILFSFFNNAHED